MRQSSASGRERTTVVPFGVSLRRALVVGALAVVAWGAHDLLGASPSFVCDATPVVAEEGDTLWAIAEARCDGDIRLATDEAFRAFGSLSVGELVAMPEREGCRLVLVGAPSPEPRQDCR